MILSQNQEQIYCKKASAAEQLLVSASLSRYVLHRKLSLFQKVTPYSHIFFHLKYFLWKGPLRVKIRKKIIDQILGYISFYFEICAHLGHLFAKINMFNWWSCSKKGAKHKVKSYIYSVNQFLRKKYHKRWNEEYKQKQSCLFNFCNIFYFLTSRTKKIAWWVLQMFL